MQINLNPTSERGASRDAVNRPRETSGASHLISSYPRSRFGLYVTLIVRGNTTGPYNKGRYPRTSRPLKGCSRTDRFLRMSLGRPRSIEGRRESAVRLFPLNRLEIMWSLGEARSPPDRGADRTREHRIRRGGLVTNRTPRQ